LYLRGPEVKGDAPAAEAKGGLEAGAIGIIHPGERLPDGTSVDVGAAPLKLAGGNPTPGDGARGGARAAAAPRLGSEDGGAMWRAAMDRGTVIEATALA